jgi:hypothetical protein
MSASISSNTRLSSVQTSLEENVMHDPAFPLIPIFDTPADERTFFSQVFSENGDQLRKKIEQVSLKTILKLLAGEKFFMEMVASSECYLASSLQMIERMKAEGYLFLREETGIRSMLLPSFQEMLPWPLLRIVCDIQQSAFDVLSASEREQKFRVIISKISRTLEAFPDHRTFLENRLTHLEYMRLRAQFFKRQYTFEMLFSEMQSCVKKNPTFPFSEATSSALTAWQEFLVHRDLFNTNERFEFTMLQLCCKASIEDEKKLAKELATMEDDIWLRLCKKLEASFEKYRHEFPKQSTLYATNYFHLLSSAEKKHHCKGSFLASVLSMSERHVWASLLVPPEKFANLSLPTRVASLFEVMRVEMQQYAESPADSIAPPRISQKRPKKKPSHKKISKPIIRMPEEKVAALTEEAPAPMPPPATQSALATLTISISSQPLKALTVTRKVSHIKALSPPRCRFARLPEINDGPNPNQVYDIHVARWFIMDEETNPFLCDPAYEKCKTAAQQAGALFQHTFALAMHRVLIRSGCAFEMKDHTGKVLRTTFTAIGVIEFPDRPTENGIFTVARDGEGTIFHAHFNRLQPCEILCRMANEGWQRTDKKPKALTDPARTFFSRTVYNIADDGSRVTEVTDDHISVRDVWGRIFRAFPLVVCQS